MRDLLVCYLLDELSESEKVALEAQLAADPRLSDELERLRQCMFSEEPPADCSDAPPRSLLDRTVKCVSDSQAGDGGLRAVEPPAGRCSFSLVDAIVAVGVVFAISMLLLPALRESRDISRRNACQNNLRQLGFAFIDYSKSKTSQGQFPQANLNENAGIYAVKLAEAEYLDRRQLSHVLICPASAEADAINKGTLVLQIPRYDRVANGVAKLPPQVRATMGGSYACRVGYIDGKVFVSIYNRGNCRSPILSDAPSSQNLAASSPHHGGCGQNVLFEDGHVAYVVGYYIPAWDNHMFLNDDRQAAAGKGSQDVVMARSEIVPAVRAVPTDGQE